MVKGDGNERAKAPHTCHLSPSLKTLQYVGDPIPRLDSYTKYKRDPTSTFSRGWQKNSDLKLVVTNTRIWKLLKFSQNAINHVSNAALATISMF